MGREAPLGLGLRQLSSQYSQGEANVQLLHPSRPIPSHPIPQPHREHTFLSAAQTCSLPSKSAERQKEALGSQCCSWIQPGLHHSAWSMSLVPLLAPSSSGRGMRSTEWWGKAKANHTGGNKTREGLADVGGWMETPKHMRREERRSGRRHVGRLLPHGRGRRHCREWGKHEETRGVLQGIIH